VTAKAYFDACAAHDFLYFMSDDNSVYRKGDKARTRLIRVSDESPEHKAIWDAWVQFSRKGWGKPSWPMPDAPKTAVHAQNCQPDEPEAPQASNLSANSPKSS
jgi:hypothetical protein